ncbi:DNA-directed RNA polymerase subunit H [Nanoarchaeota archaeon]
MKDLDITKHVLVPKHVKLSEKEKKELFEKYNITMEELPKILIKDAAIKNLNVKAGDVIKVVRISSTAGESNFYRGVINV